MKVTIESEKKAFHAETKFNKIASKFSNSSHVILPKEFVGRNVVVFILKKIFKVKEKVAEPIKIKAK